VRFGDEDVLHGDRLVQVCTGKTDHVPVVVTSTSIIGKRQISVSGLPFVLQDEQERAMAPCDRSRWRKAQRPFSR